MVWTAALLYLCGGVACLAAVVYPVSPHEPIRLDLALGLFACAVAAFMWLAWRRLPPLAFQLAMVLGAVTVSTIVADARTRGGVMLTAFAYPWMAVYTAHFFSRRAITALSLVVAAGFGAGLLIDGLSHMAIDWVIVTGTVCSTGLVLGNLSESLRQQADTDQLTGLLNRGGFLAAATRERAIAERTGSPLTLAVLDLDGFKQINDSEGHAAGDRLLAELGRQWRARLRAGDILGRHGGDEFVLLLPATARAEADGVLARLHVPELAVGWSVGVSEWLPGEALDACMARADRSLYGVKEAQRGRPAGEEHPFGALVPSV
jgi:diguanylate cyclase (GGDEF)-like protein